MADRTILIFGPTGSGKTAQLGELAEAHFKETGTITRLYTADKGGVGPIAAHCRAGLIDAVYLDGLNPWAFEYAVQGMVPMSDNPAKWVLDEKRNASIGLWAFESIYSWSMLQMLDLATRAAGKNGKLPENIGGQAPIRFSAGGDHQALMIGSNNQAHFGIVQGNLRTIVWNSFNLPGTVVWTSLDTRGTDPESGTPIVAPMLVGKAGVDLIPSWFHYTFHLVVEPSTGTGPAVHRLYMSPHRDMSVGGVSTGLANNREPLGLAKPLPTCITPANVPEALRLLQGLEEEKVAQLRAEMAKRGVAKVT